VSGTYEISHSFGDRPHYRKLYFEKYMQLDPVLAAIALLQPGEVISNSSVMPRAEFLGTQFYQGWMAPQGWLDNAYVILDRSPTKITAFAVSRSKQDGWVDSGVFQRMQLIAPHVRRSLLAGEAVRQRSIQAARLTDTLDGIDAAVFFVDGEGRILHKNATGAAMLADGVLSGAAIEGQQASENATGEALLAMFTRSRRHTTAEDRQSVCAPMKSLNGDQYVLHALPLTTGRRPGTDAEYQTIMALFVQKATIGGVDAAGAIERHFGLTPAELRVLLTLIEVGGVPETSKALGIAETTVKTHLRGLFAKTRTGRQIDLARLVAGFSGGLSR
jgi:DNA-binding CsgD family transcriptional regulator